MNHCCANGSLKIAQAGCPRCGTVGKAVGMRTLYHQVRFPENQQIVPGSYYFCPAKQCSIGYFSSTEDSIPQSYLTTYQAIQKDRLCYCFDIDTEAYLLALRISRADSIKEFVVQRTKAGDCACECRNPSGRCCLAEFKRLEKMAE